MHVPPPTLLFYINASLKELSLNFYLINGTQKKSELLTNLLAALGKPTMNKILTSIKQSQNLLFVFEKSCKDQMQSANKELSGFGQYRSNQGRIYPKTISNAVGASHCTHS